jgi:hypothetical protein
MPSKEPCQIIRLKRRYIKKYETPAPPLEKQAVRLSNPDHRSGKMTGPPADRGGYDPESFQNLLQLTWGSRLRVDPVRGYLLDEKPINLDPLVKCTNVVRKHRGQPQIPGKREWEA